jgi:hypothetical protein
MTAIDRIDRFFRRQGSYRFRQSVPVCDSGRSNGMSEAFVKTFKREYVYITRLEMLKTRA